MFRARNVRVIEPGAIGLAMLASAGLGAALMYFLDPVSGRRRRAVVVDEFVHAGHSVGDATGAAVNAAIAQTRGYIKRAQHLVSRGDAPADDATLVERVRAALGHVLPDIHAIEVRVRDGAVTLKGPVRADQIEEIVACAGRVRGVGEVDNRLSVSDDTASPPRDPMTH